MTRTPDQAIAHCYNQSSNGPSFTPGMCKARTRTAYGVPSDGSKSAAEAWSRTKHRIGPGPVRGALRWYLGGADGNGHVTIDDGKGGEWSVDITRPGYWDHVEVGTITARWPSLRFVGLSLDIDGVQVVPNPAPAKPPTAEPTVLTRLRNAWRDGRVVHWTTFDSLIRKGTQPDAKAALIARDKIAAAMREFLDEVDR